MDDIVKSDVGDGHSSDMLQWFDAHATGPIANDRAPAGGEDDHGFAGRLYQLCLRALHEFYQERNKRSSKSRSHVLRECLGRLYLWGEPFGVGELDKALRQSDELRDNVLERLGHIGKLLLRKSAPSTRPSKELHQPPKQISELESAIKQGKLIVSRDGDEIPQNGHETDQEYDSGGEGLSDSGSYDTIEDIDFATTCLMELGPSLEQNLVHAVIARHQRSNLTSVPFSVSGPATIYVSLVREKFKQAHYKLVERLGEANWQRHKDIREKMENAGLSTEERVKLAGETDIACSLFRPYSDFQDTGIGTSVPAQTEYAPSHTSSQSSIIEGEQVSLRVPREPSEVGAGKPFQCFLCKCIISSVRNRADWKMHVFADLRPYICTFPDCKDELAQFTTRAAWADHEFTEHRHDQSWNCPECSEEVAGASDWEHHLQEMHRRVFTGPQLHVARNTAYQMKPRPIGTEECPLCRVVLGKPRRAFVKHVARHMEEIALMALPHSTDDDSDESSTSTNQISQGSEIADVLAAETRSEAREEMSHDQMDKSATNDSKSAAITPQEQQTAKASAIQMAHSEKRWENLEVLEEKATDDIAREKHKMEPSAKIFMNGEKRVLADSIELPHPSLMRKGHHKAAASEADVNEVNSWIDELEGSGGFVDSDAKKGRGKAAPPGRCHRCGRPETPEWRCGPDGSRTLCNSCGLRHAWLTRKMEHRASASTGSSGLRPKDSIASDSEREYDNDPYDLDVDPIIYELAEPTDKHRFREP